MSDFQISVHHPDLDPDTVFEVDGVGEVKNGGTLTVTDEQQEFFRQDRGYELKDALEENPIIGVGKAKPNIETGRPTPNEKRSMGTPDEVIEVPTVTNETEGGEK